MYESCPISGELVGAVATRLVAGFVLALGLAYLASGPILIPVLLTLDFALRSYALRRFSPLRAIAVWLVTALRLKEKRINAGPKIFSAKIGLGLTALMLVSQLLGGRYLAIGLGSMLCFFALLESVFGLCVGCELYAALQKRKLRSQGS